MTPSETKSVNIFKPGSVGIITEPIRKLKSDEVLCEIKCAGICGTDNGIFNGEFSDMVDFPLRPGHEWTGVIAAVGSDELGYKIGDRVVGETGHSCGKCAQCVAGNKVACENVQSVGTVHAWPGAMTQYGIFAARDLLKLPDCISFEDGALIEPTANALMAVDNAGVYPGSTVIVMGTGPIGIAAAAIARIYGATTVISVGRSPFKLELCKKLGATHTINTREISSVEDEVLRITGGKKADFTIELSGALSLFESCVNLTRTGGTLTLLAFYDRTTEIDLNKIIFAGITVRTAGGGWGYFPKVLRLMETGALKLTDMITSRISLGDAPREIENLKKDNSEKIKIMICN